MSRYDGLSMNAAESDLKADLQSLFERLNQGDLNALEGLYDRFATQIYGLALWRTKSASDAADVVQEVFLRLAGRTGRLGDVRHPHAYLLQMTHRISCDLQRKRRPETTGLLIEPVSNDPEAALHAAQLSGFLKQLPAKQREVLYLRYFSGLTLKEVAKVVGVTLFTAASRCRLGLNKLKERFGEEV
jgi:RNA polymerase sigma-70 factor, ECF subfamily